MLSIVSIQSSIPLVKVNLSSMSAENQRSAWNGEKEKTTILFYLIRTT